MLARLIVSLPFKVWMPEGQDFDIQCYDEESYKVRLYPLGRCVQPSSDDMPEETKVDNIPAFQADMLQIDFQKDNFERRTGSPPDPPVHVLERAINSFLNRLRYIAHAPGVLPLELESSMWMVKYLQDDGSEVEIEKGFIRCRSGRRFTFSLMYLNQNMWNDIIHLEPTFEAPVWETLLLDAKNELPRIGPAIVLTATALEVFISQMLDNLATLKGLPAEFWTWLNKREHWTQWPSFKEQFDALLKFLSGHSLQEDLSLWEALKNLKEARNKFVHEGVARIGGRPVTHQKTIALINSAANIIKKIKEWLPRELHWKEFEHKVSIQIMKKVQSPRALLSGPAKSDPKGSLAKPEQ
jgi:hypothetical protein